MQRSKQWQTGLCDCSASCCFAFILPCCMFSRNVRLMENINMGDIPVVDECGCSKCNKPMCAGILYALGLVGGVVAGNAPPIQYTQYANLLGCFSVYIHSRVRGIIRRHNSIDPDCCGEGCTDFCCALFCYSCSMAQEERQLLYLIQLRHAPAANSMFDGVRMDPATAPSYAAVHGTDGK